MNLRIGKIKNYNNKILVSSPSFKIGTNLTINLDGGKDKPDVKPKGEGIVRTKPNTGSNKERKQDVKSNIEFDKESKPDMNKITYDEEKVAFVLGITSVKPKGEGIVRTKPNTGSNKEHKQDVKPNIKFDRESNQDVKKPDTNKITYEEEKVALILETTAVFTVWWMFK